MKFLGVCLGISAFALSACGSGGGGDAPLNTGSTPTAEKTVSKLWRIEKDEDDISYRLTLNGRTYSIGDAVDFKQFPMGLSESSFQDDEVQLVTDFAGTPIGSSPMKKRQHTQSTNQMRIYHQPYSVVFGAWGTDERVDGKQVDWAAKGQTTIFEIARILGLKTTEQQIKTMAGKAVYRGEAFNQTQQGKLVYEVDFDKREGSGSITGLQNYGDITLHKAAIGKQELAEAYNSDGAYDSFREGVGVKGKASGNGLREASYGLLFFGPKAEEVAGYIEHPDERGGSLRYKIIGFGGKR